MKNVIYTKNNCPQCKTVLALLDQRGITDFQTKNLDSMPGHVRESVITEIAFVHGVIPKTAPIIVWDSQLKSPEDFITMMRGKS